MKSLRALPLVLVAASCAGASRPADSEAEPPAATAVETRAKSGPLVSVGGGGTPDAVVERTIALAGGNEPSQFKKENESLHRKEHSGYNCQNCHLSHGSSGTAGINRGRLLMNYMDVNNFPYTGEGSCGTNPNGGFSCH